MSLLPGYFGLGKKEKALENTDSKFKTNQSVPVRGLFPVVVLHVRQTAHPKPLWISKGKSKIFLTKDILGFRVFCLNFVLRKMWGFQQGLLCLLNGMMPMGSGDAFAHSWFRAEPFIVGTRGTGMK